MNGSSETRVASAGDALPAVSAMSTGVIDAPALCRWWSSGRKSAALSVTNVPRVAADAGTAYVEPDVAREAAEPLEGVRRTSVVPQDLDRPRPTTDDDIYRTGAPGLEGDVPASDACVVSLRSERHKGILTRWSGGRRCDARDSRSSSCWISNRSWSRRCPDLSEDRPTGTGSRSDVARCRAVRSVYSMCMARRNISIPDDLDERARRARLNVSALAQRAVALELDRQSRMSQLDAWLDELDANHGAPSAKAMASAREWAASGRKVESRVVAGRPVRAKTASKVRRAAG